MLGMPMMKKFDLHPCHVHSGWTLPPTGLAGNAEIQRLLHCVRDESIRPKLSAQRKAQAVGASAGDVLFVPGRQIARTHHCFELATMPVVVAHLGGTEKATRLRPIERCFYRQPGVTRLVSKEPAVIHLRRSDDFPGIQEPGWIERVLDRLESMHQAFAKNHFVKFGS